MDLCSLLEVSGRSPRANELKLTRVLRMKTAIEDPSLGSATIAGLMAATDDTLLPSISKFAAHTLIKRNADPRNPINMENAGIEPMVAATSTRLGRTQPMRRCRRRTVLPRQQARAPKRFILSMELLSVPHLSSPRKLSGWSPGVPSRARGQAHLGR